METRSDETGVNDRAGLPLKPREKLAEVYAKLDPTRETIVRCESGNRAAEGALVLADLGFRTVKVYDLSWF